MPPNGQRIGHKPRRPPRLRPPPQLQRLKRSTFRRGLGSSLGFVDTDVLRDLQLVVNRRAVLESGVESLVVVSQVATDLLPEHRLSCEQRAVHQLGLPARLLAQAHRGHLTIEAVLSHLSRPWSCHRHPPCWMEVSTKVREVPSTGSIPS